MNELEINKRKTFGIVSHPDAGKTTLTEKLLLFGGAIEADVIIIEQVQECGVGIAFHCIEGLHCRKLRFPERDRLADTVGIQDIERSVRRALERRTERGVYHVQCGLNNCMIDKFLSRGQPPSHQAPP